MNAFVIFPAVLFIFVVIVIIGIASRFKTKNKPPHGTFSASEDQYSNAVLGSSDLTPSQINSFSSYLAADFERYIDENLETTREVFSAPMIIPLERQRAANPDYMPDASAVGNYFRPVYNIIAANAQNFYHIAAARVSGLNLFMAIAVRTLANLFRFNLFSLGRYAAVSSCNEAIDCFLTALWENKMEAQDKTLLFYYVCHNKLISALPIEGQYDFFLAEFNKRQTLFFTAKRAELDESSSAARTREVVLPATAISVATVSVPPQTSPVSPAESIAAPAISVATVSVPPQTSPALPPEAASAPDGQRHRRIMAFEPVRKDVSVSFLELLAENELDRFIENLFMGLSFDTYHTPKTDNSPVDFIAEKNGIVYGVMAKAASLPFDSYQILQLGGELKKCDVERGYLITTANIYEDARKAAVENGIEIWDKQVLADKLAEVSA